MLTLPMTAAASAETALTANERQRRAAGLFAILLFIIAACALPVARDHGPVIAPFLPAYITAVLVFELLTAVLFSLQYRQQMRASTLVLGCAYLYTGLVVIPHILTFPGVFSPTGLLGAGSQSSVWLWVGWHGGYPCSCSPTRCC